MRLDKYLLISTIVDALTGKHPLYLDKYLLISTIVDNYYNPHKFLAW